MFPNPLPLRPEPPSDRTVPVKSSQSFPPEPIRREFHLWHLFVLVGAIAVPLALGTQGGEFGILLAYGLVSLEIAFGVWWMTRRIQWAWASFIGLHILVCAGPVFNLNRHPRWHQTQCSHNLKQIALALAVYEEVHGSLPPAVTYDASGRPMHSWRVLILPHIEEQALYSQYRFDEPWDSANNLQVAQAMPFIYQCPSSHVPGTFATPYLAVVGDDTLWPDGVGLERKAISAEGIGTSDKVLLVEVPYSKILWTEPRDLPVDELPLLWQQRTRQNASAWHRDGGVHYASLDYSVQTAVEADAAQLYRDAHIHPRE